MKDNRATVKAAKIAAIGAVITALIAGTALIISTNDLNILKQKPNNDSIHESKSIEERESLEKPPGEITSDSIVLNINKLKILVDELYYKKLIDSLNLADDMYGLKHYASAYRLYKRIYESMPNSLKDRINQTDVKKAQNKYRSSRYPEAAYLMKINLDSLKEILIIK